MEADFVQSVLMLDKKPVFQDWERKKTIVIIYMLQPYRRQYSSQQRVSKNFRMNPNRLIGASQALNSFSLLSQNWNDYDTLMINFV